MKVLFLTPYPTEGASNRYRVEQLLPYLEQEGIRYSLRPFVSTTFYGILYQRGRLLAKAAHFLVASLRRLGDLVRAIRADVVFIHREAYPLGPPIIEWLLALIGKPIVYDFDDAVFLPSSSPSNLFIERFKFPSKIAFIIRKSTWVIAGNDYLASFARQFHDRVTVVPTCMDMVNVQPKRALKHDSQVIIGWIGSVTTQRFLCLLDDVCIEIAQRYPEVEFHYVGGQHELEGVERMVYRHWLLEREPEDLRSFDIGVMPMPDDPWTQGKCGFKAIQYMAYGLPVVCSPVGVTTVIVDDGHNGFLAESPKEWVEALSRLIEDSSLRERMGQAGRKKVEHLYDMKVHAHTIVRILREVNKGRSGSMDGLEPERPS
ncbi:glycosyltransferase family 4 protein [Nitrospinae bacterium AH_259_B05_G02_I21]|nr:glycosyltransferase family 4 protein [Nitrospinae bacterium AH_259_B05_G02_I21]MDA2931636.1 glycosyltransferase family 4 protein [Nitrospinae bacterium AH-259-F20]